MQCSVNNFRQACAIVYTIHTDHESVLVPVCVCVLHFFPSVPSSTFAVNAVHATLQTAAESVERRMSVCRKHYANIHTHPLKTQLAIILGKPHQHCNPTVTFPYLDPLASHPYAPLLISRQTTLIALTMTVCVREESAMVGCRDQCYIYAFTFSSV